jgi:hypothetical protein
MAFISLSGDACSTVVSIGENVGLRLDCVIGLSSPDVKYPDCCIDCTSPVISQGIYEGYSYIPFTLNMQDGTSVVETTLGGTGVVSGGVGMIELDNPVTAGTVINIRVDNNSCKAIGNPIVVKEIPEQCDDCLDANSCHIRIVNIKFSTSDNLNATISSLNIENNAPVQYSINSGKWYDTWEELSSIKIGSTFRLGIKVKGNPNCRITKSISVIQKTTNVTQGGTPDSSNKCSLPLAWVSGAVVTCVSSGNGSVYMEVFGNDGNVVEFYDQDLQGWREANSGNNGYRKTFSNGNYSTHARIKGCTNSIEGFFTVSCATGTTVPVTPTVPVDCGTSINWNSPIVTCVSSGQATAYLSVSGDNGLTIEFFNPTTKVWQDANVSNNGINFTVSNGQHFTHARVKNCSTWISGNFSSAC